MVRVTSDKKRIGYRNNQIESLRGFAILIIVVYHMFNRFQQIYLESSIRWMDFWGTLGVSTFLMMSSYFLVKPNQGVISFNGALFKFFRKVLRLYPCYVVSISITFICTQSIGLPNRTVEFKDYLMNIFFLNRFFSAPYVDGAHWYLGVLLSATLIILFLQIFNLQDKPLVYILWMIIELLIDKAKITGNMYPLGGPFVGCICIGITIRYLFWNVDYNTEITIYQLKKNFRENYGWYFVVGCALLCTFLSRGVICTIELIGIPPILILCSLNKLNYIVKRWSVFLGTISYPVYLIHQNLGFIIELRLMKFFDSYNYIIPILTTVSVIAIGAVLYYFMERPVQKILKKMGL